MTEFDEHWDFRVGLLIGVFSAATVVAVTGVGSTWCFMLRWFCFVGRI